MKAIAIAALVVLACVVLFSGACLFTPAASRCDFNYRMAELDCVRQGVDPFRVWNEEVVVRPYYSNNSECKKIPPGCTEMISVYVPWEYSIMLPFSMLSRDGGWWTYSTLTLLLCLLALFVCYVRMRRTAVGVEEAVISTVVPALLVCYPLWSNHQVGNHIAVVLLATALLAFFLNRGQDVLAGLCWMLMMIKPQIGLIFAVPLVMRLRIRTGIVAVLGCVLLSVWPSLKCGTPMLDMWREPAIASAFAFGGCGTWPRFLCGSFAGSGDILAGTLVGAAVCACLTWLVRREEDWFIFLMPAAVVSCCWTYTQAYSHAMCWFLAYAVVHELVLHPRSRFLWVLFSLCAFSLSRGLLAWHGLYVFAGWTFPMSEYAYRCLDTLNSTLTLALAAAFCLYKRSR